MEKNNFGFFVKGTRMMQTYGLADKNVLSLECSIVFLFLYIFFNLQSQLASLYKCLCYVSLNKSLVLIF